jgi:hypothetical protein
MRILFKGSSTSGGAAVGCTVTGVAAGAWTTVFSWPLSNVTSKMIDTITAKNKIPATINNLLFPIFSSLLKAKARLQFHTSLLHIHQAL